MAPRAGREPPPWVVLPRKDVLDAAAAALSEHAGMVIVGGPGAGKTTVARAAALAASPSCRWAVGTETGRDIPLGAFGHLLTALPEAGDRLALLTEARSLLAADPSTDVLVVDDAHLLDPLSATLLHQLVLARSVRAVVTLRDGAPTLDAVTSLWKDGQLARLELGPFSRTEVDAVLTSLLPGTVESATAARIWETSEGNPLLIRSIVTSGLESGALERIRGVWQLRGPSIVTAEIEEVFAARLRELDPAVRRVTELLALGGPMPMCTLQAMAEQSAIEEAEQRDLIRLGHSCGGLAARLAHTMLGEVVRARTGIAKTRRLRGELACQLAENTTGTVDRLRIATLLLDSDMPVRPEIFTAAAVQALALGNLELTERLSRKGSEVGGGFDAELMLANTLAWLGSGEEAEQCFAEIDDHDLTVDQRSRLAVSRSVNLHCMLRDPAQALQILRELRTQLRAPEPISALDAAVAMNRLYLGELTESLRTARKVLAAPSTSDGARAWASAAGALAAALLGRAGECTDMLEHWHLLDPQADTGLLEITVALAECHALTTIGEFDAALRRAVKCVERAAGQNPASAMALIVLGKVQLARGELLAARTTFEQAAATFDRSPVAVWALLATLYLGRAQAQLGDACSCADSLQTARNRFGSDVAVYAAELELSMAWSAAAEGDLVLASRTALTAADLAADSGQVPTEIAALHAHTRFGGRRAASRLRVLADRQGTPAARLMAAHAEAFEQADADALETLSQEFEAAGDRLSAAGAAAQAAQIHAHCWDHKRELAAGARAHWLSTQCDGGPLPALTAAARPLPLTERELEIARMVASGLTNRDIAERLVVSVRTIEGHLYRMSIKLDVHDRGELSRVVLGTRSGRQRSG